MPERARIDQPQPNKRLDALPVLYLVGFVILAASLIYLWKHPSLPRNAALEVARMDGLREQINAIQGRVDQLETRKAGPDVAALIAPLQERVVELSSRPQSSAPPPPDLAPLITRITALEQRPLPPPPVDMSRLEARIAALEGKPPVDLAPLQRSVDAVGKKAASDLVVLGTRLDGIEAQGKETAEQGKATAEQGKATAEQGKQTADRLGAVALQAQLSGKLQAAAASLAAGQSVGDLPGAPPALARFARDKPPTEAGLRLSFDKAAGQAHRVSQPELTDDQPLLSRMWTRAQQAVTVRQGEHVLLGDPIAGTMAAARQSLDAGDLAGAVTVLDGLSGPAKAAMADWVGQARSLLDARAAIGAMAARG